MKSINRFNAARLGKVHSFVAAWKKYRHTLKVVPD